MRSGALYAVSNRIGRVFGLGTIVVASQTFFIVLRESYVWVNCFNLYFGYSTMLYIFICYHLVHLPVSLQVYEVIY